jgi:hypothetical protein
LNACPDLACRYPGWMPQESGGISSAVESPDRNWQQRDGSRAFGGELAQRIVLVQLKELSLRWDALHQKFCIRFEACSGRWCVVYMHGGPFFPNEKPAA